MDVAEDAAVDADAGTDIVTPRAIPNRKMRAPLTPKVLLKSRLRVKKTAPRARRKISARRLRLRFRPASTKSTRRRATIVPRPSLSPRLHRLLLTK